MTARRVKVAGLDGWRKGWVAVIVDGGRVDAVTTFATFAEALDTLGDADAIGVDIPIGLPVVGHRAADLEARWFLAPKGASVFPTPPRAVMEAATYEEARRIGREQFKIGVVAQMYMGLRAKVLEVDALVKPGDSVYEVHPEVSFRVLAGRPLAFGKKTWNGQMERRRLLKDAGLVIPDVLDAARMVPADDVLDAAAAAWTAGRIARDEAGSLPSPPEQDERGHDMAIWM